MKKTVPILVTLVATILFGADMAQAGVGQVTHLSGILSVKKTDGTNKILSIKSEVDQGDVLSTQQETYARVKFVDGGEVVLRPGSQLKIESYAYEPEKPQSDNIFLSMFKGGLRAVTGLIGKRNRDKVSFSTSTATIGIRGTHFGALLCNGDCGGVQTTSGQAPANGLHIDVASGAVVVTNPAGSQLINTGQFGYVQNANTPPVIVPPQQAVPVTMPSSIAQNKGGGHGIGKGKDSECVAQ